MAQNTDAAFAQTFATPEFRGIGRDHGEIVSRVASVLATYTDLTEETATKILTNAMLLTRLRNLDKASDDFQRLIHEELVEALQQERDQALEQMRQVHAEATQVKAMVQEEMTSIFDQLQAEGNSELAARIGKLEERLTGQPSSDSKINVERVYMGNANEYSGGYFQNAGAQVGAQGPGAKAQDFTQQADQRQIRVDLPTLAAELDTLKQALIQEATTSADYQAVAEVQAAKEAASAGDEPTIWRHLANAGRWAFDVAVRIGTEMAATALDHALGVGG